MTKTRKNLFLTVFLAFLLAASMCLFASCEDTDKPVTYTVTVQTDATTPASGVTVQIQKDSARFDSKTTDANGKAEFQLAPDSYQVALSTLPEHYSVPQNASLALTADNRNLTVTLEKNFVYTVKLVTADGNPYYAEGVSVGICTLDGNCLVPVSLGENGVAVIDAAPGDYHVKVNDLPATATIACDENGYYTGKNFSAEDNEMTITVYTATEVTTGVVMTDAEKEEYFPWDLAARQRTAYKLQTKLAAGEIAYYAINAAISGQYGVYTDYNASYMYNETTFVVEGSGNYLPQTLVCTENNTYYFKAVNQGEEPVTTQIVVTVPFSSYIQHSGKGGSLELTVGKEATNAIVAFTPTEAGMYKMTAKGATPTLITATAYSAEETLGYTPADNEYSANASTSYMVYTSSMGSTVYLAATTKAASYPADIQLTIEKVADPVDTTKVMTVSEKLTTFSVPENKELYGIPLDGSAEIVYNSADRFYHYGTENGPVVVVNITGALDSSRFEVGGQLAYLEQMNTRLATYKFITRNADGENVVDYTVFLRGFDEYEYQEGPLSYYLQIPQNIETEVYYAKFVNEDGMYPMTEELKVFLEAFYAANQSVFDWQVPWSADLDSAWLFPCYYYDDITEADVIVGEYKFVRFVDECGKETVVGGETMVWDDENSTYVPAIIGDNEYKLQVNKNGEFVISQLFQDSYDGLYSGTWSKDDNGNYTFIEPFDTWEMIDLVYTVTFDPSAGTIKLEGSNGAVWEFQA